jgi:hypothetical protein
MNRLEIRNQIRTKIQDWPITDTLINSITATDEVLKVNNIDRYNLGGLIQIGNEIMRVQVLSETSKQISVIRGFQNTTAAIASASTAINIFSRFTDAEINTEITNAFNMIFPNIYQGNQNTSLISTAVMTYDISAFSPAIVEKFGIYKVELKDSDQEIWREITRWYYEEGTLHLEAVLPAGQAMRISYISQYAAPEDDEDDSWTLPTQYTEMIQHYVLGRLQESNLNLRIQYYQFSASANPDAASVGDVMGVAGYSLYQFRQLLEEFATPLPAFRPNRRLQQPGLVIARDTRPLKENVAI